MQEVLKVVVDTSVFCAALKSKTKTSIAAKIIQCWLRGDFVLVMAPQLLEELVEKLLEIGVPEQDVEDLVTNILEMAKHIPCVYEATRLDDIDPDDNMFLAAAYEIEADFIVSRDDHLLYQKHLYGTQILEPPEFFKMLNEQRVSWRRPRVEGN